jgi:hypothetical protein
VPLDGPGQGGVAGVVVDGPPDGQGHPPARGQDPPCLGQGERPVGEELQALLAADQVDGAVGQWRGGGLGLAPLDPHTQAGRGRLGDLDHPLVEIGAGDGPAGPDPEGGLAGHDPGAAGDVEHPLAGPHPGQVEQPGRAGREQGGHEVPLVGGRPLALELVSVGDGGAPSAGGQDWHDELYRNWLSRRSKIGPRVGPDQICPEEDRR